MKLFKHKKELILFLVQFGGLAGFSFFAKTVKNTFLSLFGNKNPNLGTLISEPAIEDSAESEGEGDSSTEDTTTAESESVSTVTVAENTTPSVPASPSPAIITTTPSKPLPQKPRIKDFGTCKVHTSSYVAVYYQYHGETKGLILWYHYAKAQTYRLDIKVQTSCEYTITKTKIGVISQTWYHGRKPSAPRIKFWDYYYNQWGSVDRRLTNWLASTSHV